jgi:hypothetical protein
VAEAKKKARWIGAPSSFSRPVAHPAVAATDPERVPPRMLGNVLSGGFSSQVLRPGQADGHRRR